MVFDPVFVFYLMYSVLYINCHNTTDFEFVLLLSSAIAIFYVKNTQTTLCADCCNG